MFIANISINKSIVKVKEFLKRKIVVRVFCIICILLIIFISIFTIKKVGNIKEGNIISNIMEKLGLISNDNVFNMKSYSLIYEMTICSNKNINTYEISECFKEGIGTKFELLDSEKRRAIILVNNRQLTIYNESQKNVFKLEEYSSTFSNLMSVKTFTQMYKNIQDNYGGKCCCFKVETFEKGNNIKLVVQNSIDEKVQCECSYRYLTENVSRAELYINKKTGIPESYMVKDNNNKPYISIVYSKFDINANLKDDVFKIN